MNRSARMERMGLRSVVGILACVAALGVGSAATADDSAERHFAHLKSPYDKHRNDALDELGRLGPEWIERTLPLLTDENAVVRATGLDLLGRLVQRRHGRAPLPVANGERLVAVLSKMFGDASADVRRTAYRAAARLAGNSEANLYAVLKGTDDPELGPWIGRATAHYPIAMIEPLLPYLREGTAGRRCCALHVCVQIVGDHVALRDASDPRPLVRALHNDLMRILNTDSSPAMLALAADVVATANAESAIPRLAQLVGSNESVVVSSASRALTRFGICAKEATPALVAAWMRRKWSNDWGLADAVVSVGEPGVPALRNGMKNGSVAVRRSTLRALHKHAANVHAPLLVEHFLDPDPECSLVASRACFRLTRLHPSYGKTFVRGLLDGRPEIRLAAVLLLERIGPPFTKAWVGALQRASTDPDSKVAFAAGRTLEDLEILPLSKLLRTPKRQGLPTLLTALRRHSDPAIRVAAARVMHQFPFDLDVVMPALTEALRDGHWTVRLEAAIVLSRMGPRGAGAVPVLEKFAMGADISSCIRAVVALHRWGNAGQPAIMRATRHEVFEVRWVAVQRVSSEPPLLRALIDPEFRVRKAAVDALYHRVRPSRAAVLPLIAALDSVDKDLHTTILSILQSLGETAHEAAPAVLKMARSHDGARAWAAIETFAQIHKPAPAWEKSMKSRVHGDVAARRRAWRILAEIASTREAVPPWVVALLKLGLADEDVEVRTLAANVLGSVSAETAVAMHDVVVRALRDVTLREHVLEGLARWGPVSKRWLPECEKIFETAKGPEWGALARALVGIGAPAGPLLFRIASHPDDELRRAALSFLEDRVSEQFIVPAGDPTALAFAMRATLRSSRSREVRLVAARCLHMLSDPPRIEAAATMIQLIGDDDILSVVMQLLEAGPPFPERTLDLVRKLAVDPDAKLYGFWERLDSLAPAIAPTLWAQFASPAHAVSPRVREQARRGLHAIGREAKAMLTTYTEALRDTRTRSFALQAIEWLGTSGAPAHGDVAAILKQSDAHTQRLCLDALAAMGPAAGSVADEVVSFMMHAQPHVRHAAVMALVGFRDPRVVPHLRTLARDANPSARRFALSELAKMGPLALPALHELRVLLEGPDYFSEHQKRQPNVIRNDAVLVLGAIGPDARSALPVLRSSLQGDHYDVGLVATALWRIERSVFPGLVAMVEESDIRKDDDDVDAAAVIASLRGEDEAARLRGAERLARLGATALPQIRTLLHDGEDDVRRLALGAAGAMGAVALPLLPELDALVASPTTSAGLRRVAERAITFIRGG